MSAAKHQLRNFAATLVALLFSTTLHAQPYLNGLIAQLQATPSGGWVQVNLNKYSDVWAPDDLRPLNLASNPTPEKIILAWSSFSWDTKRGDLFLYGGGHANYSGNDTYRWHGTTRMWERASLPSEILLTPNGFHTAIDGVDNAPVSAHTYDNSLYLPVIDRFITFGGASYNTGNPYARPLTPTTSVITGPYLFDPSKADGNKVGGTTGSHVQRVAPHPEVVGGHMWTNRDQYQGTVIGTPPSSHINGMTAYAQENGKDVVYVASRPGQGTDLTLYRYTINDIANITLDTWERVGLYWGGPTDQGAGAYDPNRKLFVRTGNVTMPITYWDLNFASPTNKEVVIAPVDLSGSFDFSRMVLSGMDFDPVRRVFVIWYGGPDVFMLVPPTPTAATGWTLQKISVPGGAVPFANVETGVIGKFKYIPNLDAFMALQDIDNGNVWLYKPFGWTPPSQGPDAPPTVAITSPANGATFSPGAPVSATAAASDADGTVSKVDYYLDGVKVATGTTAPYTAGLTNVALGSHVLYAVATDNAGASTTSAAATFTVAMLANTPPVVSITSPASGASFASGLTIPVDASASDSDGTIASVVLSVDGSVFASFVSVGPPYTATLTGASIGTHILTATATDNLGASTTSSPVSISVTGASGGTTVTLQDGVNAYGGTRDTFLSFWNPTTNNGSATTLLESTAYVDLVRFAIFQSEGGPVPAGSTITSAQLNWYKTTSYDFTYEARRMLVDWVEGEATWNSPKIGSLWAVVGAAGAGSDYAATPDGTASVGFSPGWLRLDVTTGVRAMATGQPNFGWRLKEVSGNVNEKQFASRENANATLRPSLAVTYVPPNAPPTATITSPASGQSFALGSTITVSATATDSDGTVAKVDFFRDGSPIGTVTTAPYSVALLGLPVGSYVLTAKATDNLGASTTSSPVSISVTGASGGTTVTLQDGVSAYSGTRDTYLSFWNPTTNNGPAPTLFESAAYADLLRFAIFQSEGGPVPVGSTITSAQLNWYKTTSYDFTYEARRMLVDWVEGEATWDRPKIGSTWAVVGAAGAGSDYAAIPDGTASVGFSPGWLTLDVTSGVRAMATGQPNFGWRLKEVSGNVNEKQFASRENANASLRPSLVVTYVPPNAPPTATITSPASGQSFALGSTITVTATATDSDGTVAKVDFFRDGSPIGTVTTAPYSVVLSGLPVGSYVLTAKATDNLGASTTSSPVSISVTGASGGTTVTLQDGVSAYSGTRDTYLSFWNPTANNGPAPTLFESAAYADLLRFAIFQSEGGPVPAGSTITSAQLNWYKTTSYDFTYEARRMLVDWVEGEATWNRPKIGSLWAVVGAAGAGSDYAATPDGTASVGFSPGWLTLDVTSGVRAMATGQPNFGWRLKEVSGNVNEKQFASRENANASLRPKLVVTYTPAAQPQTVTLQQGQVGYSGAHDTFLSFWNPTANNGPAPTLFESAAYADLLRFAIFQSEGGPVPDGSTITSAQLNWFKTTSYDFTYDARRMLVDWVEGEATWNRPKIGSTWAVAGAAGAGSDYAATSDGTASVGFSPGWLTFDVTSGVRAMATGQPNFGWRLKEVSGNANEKQFASSENANASLRPSLVVTYTP